MNNLLIDYCLFRQFSEVNMKCIIGHLLNEGVCLMRSELETKHSMCSLSLMDFVKCK